MDGKSVFSILIPIAHHCPHLLSWLAASFPRPSIVFSSQLCLHPDCTYCLDLTNQCEHNQCKMSCTAAILLLLVTLLANISASDEEGKFKEFLSNFSRSYDTSQKCDSGVCGNATEKEFRFTVFKARLEKIAELNRLEEQQNPHPNRARYGITKFTDWTDFERQKSLGHVQLAHPNGEGRRNTRRRRRNTRRRRTQSASCTRHWGTTVGNQGFCSNCWAFSTAEAIRSSYIQEHGEDPGELSTQYLTDCLYPWPLNPVKKCVNGCCGGRPAQAIEWIKRNGGIPTKEAYGDVVGSCVQPSAGDEAGGGSENGGMFAGETPNTFCQAFCADGRPATPPCCTNRCSNCAQSNPGSRRRLPPPSPTPSPSPSPSYYGAAAVGSRAGSTCTGNYPMTKFQCKRGMQAAVTVSGYHQMSSEEEMASHICSTGAITVAVWNMEWREIKN